MDVEWGGRKTGAEVDGCRVDGEERKTGAEVDGCRVGRKGRLEQRWMDVEWGRKGRLEQRWMDVEWGGKEDWSRGGWM